MVDGLRAGGMPLALQGQTAAGPVDNKAAPQMRFEAEDFIKLKPGENLGEVLGVAVNSKGEVAVLNHPGTATSGPLFGNATTEILLFDRNGRFKREIGRKVYALGYGHSIRYDRYDNLWIVDKGTDSVIKFDPNGKVLMNLGRRPEGYDSGHYEAPKQADARPRDGWFGSPTDVTWDQDDNIYVSDGYVNSRVAKLQQGRRLDHLVGQVRQERQECRRESVQHRQPAQPAGRSRRKHLRRRPRQPPHPGVRSRRQLQAVPVPECTVRQDAPAGSSAAR